MKRANFYLLSGAPGTGKTTVGEKLRNTHFVAEPARAIISEQKALGGAGVFEEDTNLFINLLLCRHIGDYKRCQDSDKITIFDRGLPDVIAYSALGGIPETIALKAAETYQYNQKVFYFPTWREIYRNDDERTMSFEDCQQMDDMIRSAYTRLGYSLVEVPKASINDRLDFISSSLDHRK